MKRVWTVAFLYWIVMSVLCCWLYPCLMSDTMARYAPMADAFARGEWRFAFHPRFGVLFGSLTGATVALTGLDGGRACQVVSFFFFSFSIVPIWATVKRVFVDGRIAWVAAVLALLSSECFIFALDGLRDPCRTFGLAMCALSFVGGAPWTMALGLFCLVSLRTDLFAISGALLLAWCILRLRRREAALSLCLPVAAWSAGAFLVVLMTRAYTGYWLPGAQFVGLWQKIFGGG